LAQVAITSAYTHSDMAGRGSSRTRAKRACPVEVLAESPLVKAFKTNVAVTAPEKQSDMLSLLLQHPTVNKHFGAGVPDGSVMSQGGGEHVDSQQQLRPATLQQGSEPLPAEPEATATKQEVVEAPVESKAFNLIDDILLSMVNEPSVLGASSDMDKMLVQSLKPEMLTSSEVKTEQTDDININPKAKALKEVRWPSHQMCAR
jgi:hypothetical protein